MAEKHFQTLPIPCERILRDPALFRLVEALHHVGFIVWQDEPFTLKSGIQSHVYINGRNDLTEHPSALRMVGGVLARVIWDSVGPTNRRVPCPIGIPTAGTAMTIAAALDGRWGDFPFRVMREMKKQHGAHKRQVDGEIRLDLHDYITIDNVVTDGASKIEALDLLAADGYPVKDMQNIILVDRQQGGIKRLEERGIKTTVIFNLLDLSFVLGELKLWPKERVDAVAEEIRQHQLA